MPNGKRVGVPMNAVYRDINASKARYKVYFGSAGSGKSVNIARLLVMHLSNPANVGCNLLVVRKTKESNKDSTRAELISAINAIFGDDARNVWKIPESHLDMECVTTGNQILFRGVKDSEQREQLKSISVKSGKIEKCWIEEATQLTQYDFQMINDRLRGELPLGHCFQIYISFNPVSSSHWIKRRFFDYEDDEVAICHTTWRDNRFIDEAFKKEMLKLEEIDPEYARTYSFGEWGETGGLILTNWRAEKLDQDLTHYDAISIGQDFGFNHANAILLLGWKDGEIYVIREHYKHDMTTAEIIADVAKTGMLDDARRSWMICDSAEPDRITEWKRAGYRARPVDKGKNKATSSAIDWLQARRIHADKSCTNTIAELGGWTWQKDRVTGKYTDEPTPINDDAMAALRYGTEPFRIASRKRGRRVNI